MLIVMHRITVLLLLAAAGLRADCVTPWFPSKGTLRYRQGTEAVIGGGEMRMQHDTFRRDGNDLRFMETIVAEGRTQTREENVYHCSEAGLVPADETSELSHTTFTGVQYGNTLAPGSKWAFKWTSKSDTWTLSCQYDYGVTKKEKVKVPAGTFDAVRVDYTGHCTSSQRGELTGITGTIWMIPGKGIIKQIEDDPEMGLIADKKTLELLP